ncbi:MAG: Elongation factor Ts [Microgenomates bacterium OLB23]|nr:MAG: Elongation factor Ts [Microgenomates bacterium OLB23]
MKDIEKIKQLREETGVSYAMCTTALSEANGDMQKARELLKQKGCRSSTKKSRARNRTRFNFYVCSPQ